MRIAITGGSGFIGMEAQRWARSYGHEVWSFDKSEGNDVLGSLDALEGADSVIHLAGMLGTSELFDEAEAAVQTNVIGSLRILQWCEANDAGFVAISMPPVFPSVYTATKVCSDRLATAWHLSKGLKVSKVIAYNAFGAGQKHGHGHPQKIVPTFATLAWSNLPIPIWGDGEQGVDLVSSSDVGRVLVDATGFHGNETFDAGSGLCMSVNEVADMVLEYTGSTAGKSYLPMRDGEVATQIKAEARGWDKLSWTPGFDEVEFFRAVESYRP